MGEEHRVEVIAGLTSWRKEKGNTGGSLKSEMTGQTHVGAPETADGRRAWLKPRRKTGILKKRPNDRLCPCPNSQFKGRWSGPPLRYTHILTERSQH